jgi:tetrahydromethanopterin S-methyltransferase subunit G
MEGAVVSEQKDAQEQTLKEARIKRKIWVIYGGVVGVALVLALIIRGLIH